jgi:hypothetical protein
VQVRLQLGSEDAANYARLEQETRSLVRWLFVLRAYGGGRAQPEGVLNTGLLLLSLNQ